uniref:Uncharacterized protein n=1 Tax=Timema genevievae TaxID=629358 RepID=A0A7R9PLZ9_TIMGE|nr:unnamed protein product [Timema genevievae]
MSDIVVSEEEEVNHSSKKRKKQPLEGEDIEDPCEAANKVMGCSIMSYMLLESQEPVKNEEHHYKNQGESIQCYCLSFSTIWTTDKEHNEDRKRETKDILTED